MNSPERLPRARLGLIAAVALAAGVVAAWAARQYLHERATLLAEQAVPAAASAPSVTQFVPRLVAAHDLAAGTLLEADQVAVRDIPVEYAASNSLPPSRFEDLAGGQLNQAVRRGDPLVLAHVQPWLHASPPAHATPTAPPAAPPINAPGSVHLPVQTPLAAQLQNGWRALSLPVDELYPLAGLLQAGDVIDLYVSFEHHGQAMTASLLQAVPVLAGEAQAIDASATRPLAHAARSITLAVPAPEAAKLLLARQHGRMTAVLRHPADREPIPLGAHADLARLLGLAPAPPDAPGLPSALPPTQAAAPLAPATRAALPGASSTPAPAPEPRIVPVIYGDQAVPSIPALAPRHPERAATHGDRTEGRRP